MNVISRKIELKLSVEKAFEKFVFEFNDWWPKEYTWSNDTLEKISIAPKVGGFCTEIGPNGFRVDWGTVTDFQEKTCISFKWQIGPKRDPIPDPKKASLITVKFDPISKAEALVELIHSDFKNHGEDYLEYIKAMDSQNGWDYILKCYKEYSVI